MIKQNFKQAWMLIRTNPLVSIISIAGTALSIATIMVIVFFFQIRLGGFAPESYRDRMLQISMVRAEVDGSTNNSGLSYEVVKEVLYPLETAQVVTAMYSHTSSISLPERKVYKEYVIKGTDTGFWEVFDFKFLAGAPFSVPDFKSGLMRAVVSESTARELYNSTDVVGKVFIFDFIEYTICGVVKDISEAATKAYAEIWIPYSTTGVMQYAGGFYQGVPGPFQVVILAKEKKDFDRVREEVNQRVAVYSSTKNECEVSFPHGILTHAEANLWGNPLKADSSKDLLLRGMYLILFMLLIPALNLSGVTQVFIQQRKSELGLRKSFGATWQVLIRQIVNENMLISLIGGVIGLFFSLFLLYLCKSFLFSSNPAIQLHMLLKPGVFLWALLFTVLLNLLSSLVPALRISRQPIVEAIKEQE